MEDISGKKFSLQDWVMKRAANQSGVVVPPLSARQNLSAQEEDVEEISVETSMEVEMKAVSNGSAIQATSLPREEVKASAEAPEKKEDSPKEAAKDKDSALSALSSAHNPLQQLQIVRLLTDLGDRLRQSEKEREVLWKELEICRKQISDMGGREDKSEKTYHSLETQMNQREVFVKELVEKQIGLEQKFKEQLQALEESRQEQAKLQEKLQEKMVSVETAAGSAIVRVEDIVTENAKLAKKVEQLGQDKARLMHKLEVVEQTLTETQDTLKAKALVLLTDQAIASRTNLPHTPAWTGNDTLKVANTIAEGAAAKKETGPVADIASSLRPQSTFKMRTSTAILAGLVLLGVVGGIIGSQFIKSSNKADVAVEEPAATTDENLEPEVTGDATPAADSQEQLMAKAAQIANQIEPGSTDAATDDAVEPAKEPAADGVLPSDFESAQAAQDKAVEDFKDAAPKTPVNERIRADKSLPKVVAEIEARAFAGEGNAQHDLAAIYTAGHAGVKVNYGLAAKWFEESAHNGVANAQYNLGVLYHQGLGVKKDTAKAMELYRVAASNNHPEAQYNLAIAYVEGVGTEYNPQIAAVYFEQAATGGIVEAAYNLGLLHENGLLGESQPDEAIFWYTLAADKGNADSIKALKQLKSQLSMSDEDAARVAKKIASQRPVFKDADGKPALPTQKSAVNAVVDQAPPAAPRPAAKKSAPAAAKAPSSPVAQAPAATAKDDPVIVSQIQEQLIRLGIYKGQPNGTMSPVLSQAIKTYQQKNGMKIDGKANDDLLVHMLASGVEIASPAAGADD